MASNGTYIAQPESASAPAADVPATSGGSSSTTNGNLSKDEVGWYFVEQYYTTLSKNPDKLHLFYGKRSQFVYGQEAEVANVLVGRADIQSLIKNIGFQQCKVRVSNVDSQASFDNIVIQVIGELANNDSEPRKFAQTFVLASQPSGYFVLNDIFRYMKDEPVAEEAVEVPAAAAEPTKTMTEEAEPAEVKAEEPAAEKAAEEAPAAEPVEAKIEEPVEEAKTEESAAQEPEAEVATPAEPEAAAAHAEKPAEEPEAAPVDATVAEEVAREVAEEDIKAPERPQDPTPTPAAIAPAAAPAPAAPAQPAAAPTPAQPAKPMTWASRAAAAVQPVRPVIPKPVTPVSSAQSPSRPPAGAAATPTANAAPAAAQPAPTPAAAPAPAAASAAASSADSAEAPKDSDANEWQTAGSDSRRQNRLQPVAPHPDQGKLGYVKNVSERVKPEDLEAALAKFGKLTACDINRQKNCAFISYSEASELEAARQKPLQIGEEWVEVDERRSKGTFGYGFNTRGNTYRTGWNNRDRGDVREGGRGGFGGRGRGAGRGRGGLQAGQV